ncbi:unnamed protein product [Anisakis simplex]|uniref:B41 domain-containing protein n=1 Tax=Anisakis simplex TaxID=6269 RepID=A0A158PNH1_ANISI|nr:unnamed protein product [Anisakis simplex]
MKRWSGGREEGEVTAAHQVIKRGDSSPDSNTSGSDAVLEFTRKLQNYPLARREALRQASRKQHRDDMQQQNDHRDSVTLMDKDNQKQQQFLSSANNDSSSASDHLPAFKIDSSSSPPPNVFGSESATGGDNSLCSHMIADMAYLTADRRPSSPQAIPGLPLIEIRRPSALSQFHFDYFVNNSSNLSAIDNSTNSNAMLDESCSDIITPLLLSTTNLIQQQQQLPSRKSSEESSVGCWSSRDSSAVSQLSSSGAFRLSTFSVGTSIASDSSGTFLLSLVLRKRASTIGTCIPLLKRGISRSSGGSLRVPDRESLVHPIPNTFEMNPDFQCVRQLIVNLLNVYSKQNANIVATVRECADVLRQILNSPQHPTIKNWCAEIIQVVSSRVEPEQESALESNERINDEYLDFQDQIISGSLPCPREEAALLASIQLCVEENWPHNKRTQTIRRHLLKGQFGRIRELAQKIMVTPWEVDQTLYCTPPRITSTSAVDFATPTAAKKYCGLLGSCEARSHSVALLRCIAAADTDAAITAEIQAQCLPLGLRGDRRTVRLVKERKRKLFHSQVYESEVGMKKLYVQTAKKLPAFGCKVFQVKELVHGRTLRKVS